MDPLPPQPPFPPLPTAAGIPFPVPVDIPNYATAASTFAPATGIMAEANNNHHIAHAAAAANPTPTLTVVEPSNLPTYTDMIYAAITALKERDGSSKRAIAKYIEKAYPGLPPTHSALLTHHLKKLKNSGQLVMVKKSYKLPGSRSDSLSENTTNALTQSQPSLLPHPAVSPSPSSESGPKRGRGRPPKPKSNFVQPNNNGTSSTTVPVGLSFTSHSNVAPAGSNPAVTAANPPNAAAAEQQQVELGKRRPGRPKKFEGQGGGGGGVNVNLAPAMVVGKRRGRPPKSLPMGVKKSPGRPKKPKSVATNGVKKVPKRLPKSVVVPYATGTAAAVSVPRPRGRPRKGPVLAAPTGGVLLPAKRPGRPPKVGGGIVKPKKRSGRPAGRPRKENVNVSWALPEGSQQQAEANGELKRKFEYFQSKLKQAVGVIKPELGSATSVHALAAIQELESLAAMDISMPLREEAEAEAEAQAPVAQN